MKRVAIILYQLEIIINTTNNTCYNGGSKIKIDTSTHFVAVYK